MGAEFVGGEAVGAGGIAPTWGLTVAPHTAGRMVPHCGEMKGRAAYLITPKDNYSKEQELKE